MKLERLEISTNDKLALISNLSTMIHAGIPILETVQTLAEESKGNLKILLDTVTADLSQGQELSTSFAKFPKMFNRININIIRASEQSGNLETCLSDLKNSIRRDIEFTDKVKSALLYPTVLMVIFTFMFLGILLFVIPRIASVFQNLRVVLPLPTKIMIAVSHFMTTYTLPLVIAIIVIVVGIIVFYKTKRQAFMALIARLPLIRSIARQVDLTRFTRSLSLLLYSNIPITTALDLTQDVIISPNIRSSVIKSKNIISSGGKLSEGLIDTKKAIPSIMIKMIEAGEKSGTLDKSMQDVSDYLDYNVTNNLKTATTLLEPVILVVVGIFIGGIMMAIIGPIYNLIGQINAR
jgi:type IV pilus assembly protein PilC